MTSFFDALSGPAIGDALITTCTSASSLVSAANLATYRRSRDVAPLTANAGAALSCGHRGAAGLKAFQLVIAERDSRVPSLDCRE